ncbi:MAG: hypothetical protein ACIALR_16430, partial [Blastopirellula sp. JB062]
YVTPCYPALALLVGASLARLVSGELQASRGWIYAGFATSIAVGSGFLIGVPLALDQVLAGESILALVGLAPLLGGATAIYFLRKDQPTTALSIYGGASLAFVLLMFAFAAQRVDRHQLNQPIVSLLRESDADLFSYNALEPSWVFYAGKAICEINGDEALLQKTIGESEAPLIVMTRGQFDALSTAAQRELSVVESAPYFLRKKELVVLAPADSPLAEMAARDETTR